MITLLHPAVTSC